jgi:hypothetical protein
MVLKKHNICGTIEDLVETFTEHEETHSNGIREILEKKVPASA